MCALYQCYCIYIPLHLCIFGFLCNCVHLSRANCHGRCSGGLRTSMVNAAWVSCNFVISVVTTEA